jgi:nuclear migration protein JNM1
LINGLDISSDEEEESLERRLARLQREIAELKEEYESKEKLQGNAAEDSKDEHDTLRTLSKVLDNVHSSSSAGQDSAAVTLTKRLTSGSKSNLSADGAVAKWPTQQYADSSTHTASYAPAYREGHNLSKVSEFDSRLALIETALGIDAIPLPSQDRSGAKAIIPSLDSLDKQLTTLSTATDSSLDAISRRMRQLTQNAEKLEQARKAARVALEAYQLEALCPSCSDDTPGTAKEAPKYSELDDPETTAKINALYGTLSTIESLGPLLPSVLDRLRSLRTLHADAATASQTLAKVESQQEDMKQELQAWREGLEKVETAMQEGEQTVKGNTEVIEGWVKELEERIRNVGS